MHIGKVKFPCCNCPKNNLHILTSRAFFTLFLFLFKVELVPLCQIIKLQSNILLSSMVDRTFNFNTCLNLILIEKVYMILIIVNLSHLYLSSSPPI